MSLTLTEFVACICEGKAEKAIIDILLEDCLLIFERSQMLDEEVICCRGATEFEKRYLRKGFDKELSVIRILDSKTENFKLSKAYENKVKVVNVVTTPEIEMLIVFSEKKLLEYKNSKKKPSDFCKQNLKLGKHIKSYKFVRDYFSDSKTLVKAIRDFAAYAKKNGKIPRDMHTLSDLLKP